MSTYKSRISRTCWHTCAGHRIRFRPGTRRRYPRRLRGAPGTASRSGCTRYFPGTLRQGRQSHLRPVRYAAGAVPEKSSGGLPMVEFYLHRGDDRPLMRRATSSDMEPAPYLIGRYYMKNCSPTTCRGILLQDMPRLGPPGRYRARCPRRPREGREGIRRRMRPGDRRRRRGYRAVLAQGGSRRWRQGLGGSRARGATCRGRRRSFPTYLAAASIGLEDP